MHENDEVAAGDAPDAAPSEALAEASVLLAEAFERMSALMPPALASAIACQLIEDLALDAIRARASLH